mgnify:CR=1 FL=1
MPYQLDRTYRINPGYTPVARATERAYPDDPTIEPSMRWRRGLAGEVGDLRGMGIYDFDTSDIVAELANTFDAISAGMFSVEDVLAKMAEWGPSLMHVTCYQCDCELTIGEDELFSAHDNSSEHRPVSICADCNDNYYTTCGRCDCRNHVATCHDVGDSTWCDSCYCEHTHSCSNCDCAYPAEGYDWHTDPNGDRVCDECPHDWPECAHCGRWLDDDCTYYDEDSENDYCERCYSNIGRNSCRDYDPRRNVLGRRFRILHSQTCFGVELEVSRCPNADRLFQRGTEFGATSFGAKPDGTQGVAKEFYSPILRGDRGLKAIRHLCGFASANQWRVSKACGFHLHLDMRQFSDQQKVMIASGYAATRVFWGAMVPNTRRDNRYCYLNEALTEPVRMLGVDWENILYRNSQRYAWMNVAQAYRAHQTIEVRLHTGTLNADKVCNWVRAHLLFVDWCALFEGSQRLLFERFGRFDGLHYRFNSLDEQFAELRQVAWLNDRDLVDFYKQRAALFGATLDGFRNSHIELPRSSFVHCDV